MSRSIRNRIALFFLAFFCSLHVWAETFTIAVIPDTQNEVISEAGLFEQRAKWLAANAKELNLKMVLHSGDLVNWDTPDHAQYEKASAGLVILDAAKIPYALAIGNHDTAAATVGGGKAPGNVNTNLRTTTTFNHYFPAKRFASFRGAQSPGKVDNAYHTFSAGGAQWLVLNLELWPRVEMVQWAKTVIAGHPNHNVILLTHSHLTAKSTIDQTKGGYGDNSPQYVFDQLIKPHANVKLVFSGHVGSGGFRKDATEGGEVYQFLQCYHARNTNPVRLVEIDTGKGELRSRVYCPATDETKPDGTVTLKGVSWIGATPLATQPATAPVSLP